MRRPIFVRLVLIAAILGFSLVPLPAQAAGGLATDKVVSTHQSSPSRTVVSPAFTTSQPNELLVAFVTADGPAATRVPAIHLSHRRRAHLAPASADQRSVRDG